MQKKNTNFFFRWLFYFIYLFFFSVLLDVYWFRMLAKKRNWEKKNLTMRICVQAKTRNTQRKLRQKKHNEFFVLFFCCQKGQKNKNVFFFLRFVFWLCLALVLQCASLSIAAEAFIFNNSIPEIDARFWFVINITWMCGVFFLSIYGFITFQGLWMACMCCFLFLFLFFFCVFLRFLLFVCLAWGRSGVTCLLNQG